MKLVHIVRQAHTDRSILLTKENQTALEGTKSSPILEDPDDPVIISTTRAKKNLPKVNAEWVADALLTALPECPLLIHTADCTSIYILVEKIEETAQGLAESAVAESGRESIPEQIALIHAGWRGLQQRIVYSCLIRLLQKIPNLTTGVATGGVLVNVAFGPHARSCCYQVGAEFRNWFSGKQLIFRNSAWYLDQMAVAKSQIEEAFLFSLSPEQRKKSFLQYESEMSICTICQEEDFFSYRNRGKKNRNVARDAKHTTGNTKKNSNTNATKMETAACGRNLHIITLEKR